MREIIAHDRNNKEQIVSADKLTFRPSVYGLFFDGQKILLSKQWDGYDFPGGGINVDETVTEALKREFIEETGLIVEVGDPIHCGTSFFVPDPTGSHAGEYWNTVVIYFLVKKIGGELSTENFDEDEKNYADMAQWVEIDQVDKLKFYNGVDSPTLIKKGFKVFSSIR